MKPKNTYSIATVLIVCLLTGCSGSLYNTVPPEFFKDIYLTGKETVQSVLTIITDKVSIGSFS